MWYGSNSRFVPKDLSRPIKVDGRYTNWKWIEDGPALTHAVDPGASAPQCGAKLHRLTRYSTSWRDESPFDRCPTCLELHPL